MKIKLISALLVLLCGVSSQKDVLAETAPHLLSVEAKLTPTSGGHKLVFTVKNTSDKAVTFTESRLPWGQRDSVIIVAAERKNGSPLKEASLIDDVFMSPKVSIKPGKSLSGNIDLMYYVTDIGKKLSSTDLVLFWYFDARSDEEASLGEYGGWIVIPKK